METLSLFFLAMVGIAALLATIAVWAPRRPTTRFLAVAVLALFVPVVYVGVVDLLSRPKPLQHEWFKRHVDEATVLGVSFDEGRAIYLWLQLDSAVEPRFYVLPWQTELAQRLEDLIDEAIQGRALVRIRNLFTRKSFEDMGDINARIVPPASLPLKKPPPPARVFNPRAKNLQGA